MDHADAGVSTMTNGSESESAATCRIPTITTSKQNKENDAVAGQPGRPLWVHQLGDY